jgi:uncharacterized repeat protein (TIGR01451 family)
VIEVTNLGAEDATDVSVVTYVGDALDLVASTADVECDTDEYGSHRCAIGTLASGASTTIGLTATRVAARETWVDVWAASSADESDWENNYGGFYLEADRSNPADLQVEVTSPEQPEPGEPFIYETVVTNRGPELARSVELSQSLSEGVDFVSVSSSDTDDTCALHEETYDEEGFEEGPFTYREVRCELGNMQFAEQTTVTIEVVRNDPHELWTSAWVRTTSYDENYENDYADVSTAGHPSVTSDLVMTLDGPATTPLVGDEFTYTATVTNTGPAPATDVRLDTWLSDQLALRAVTPTRTGDTCEQDEYQGVGCTLGALAVGETTTVALDVTRIGARRYWMSSSVWSSNYDPTYDNNYVESEVKPDRSVVSDLSVKMTGSNDPEVGSTFEHRVAVTNNGPDPAGSVKATISIPENSDFVSATSPDAEDACSLFEESYNEEGSKVAEGDVATYTYREVRCELGTLVPAEAATITVTLTRTTDDEMYSGAWATTSSFDDNYENDWDSLGSYGETTDDCGVSEDDDGMIVVCDVFFGGGDAASGSTKGSVVSTSGTKRVMKTGKGNDTVNVRVPTHSKKHRRIVVNTGRGRDTIRLTVAPGAGNLTIILKGGGGRDTIEVTAPRPGKHFKLRMWGGKGNDSCSAARGDRHLQRAC